MNIHFNLLLAILTLTFSTACTSTHVINAKTAQSHVTTPATTSCKILEKYNKENKQLYGSPLLFAVSKGSLTDAECLLKAGESPDTPFNNQPLDTAINNDSLKMVELLLKYGAGTAERALHIGFTCQLPHLELARKKGNKAIIALLEKAGENESWLRSCREEKEKEDMRMMEVMESGVQTMGDPYRYQWYAMGSVIR
jgi:ankyrin repeat protein